MNQDINLELIKLQDELGALDSAVKQIEKAGQIAGAVVETTKEITQNFGRQTEIITTKVEETLKANEAFTEKQLGELTVKYQQQIDEVKVLLDSYRNVSESVAKLQPQIDKIDFPQRFEKLNQDILAINTSISLTSKIIDNLESRVRNDAETIQQLNRKIAGQNGKMNTIVLLLIIILATVGVGFGLQYLKVF